MDAYPEIMVFYSKDNSEGKSYDCSRMNRHTYREFINFAKGFVEHTNKEQAKTNKKRRPFRFYGEVVEDWPRDRKRKLSKEEMKKIGEKIKRDDERIKDSEMPADNMRREVKQRLPEKHDFTKDYTHVPEKANPFFESMMIIQQ